MAQTALTKLLDTLRHAAQTEREKGTYFEELVKTYLLTEPSYKDLFNGKVYLWEEWRRQWISQGNADPGADAGIDLVAVEDLPENPRVFAIQAKFYAEDSKIRKGDGIDSFLSAMGKKPFTNGLLFLTTYEASHHVNALIQGRDKPINIIDLFALEESQIDWAQYQPKAAPVLKQRKQLREHQQSALTAVEQGLAQAERGKLIMACGTGKTFTALKIAERVAGAGGRVLFLVPSLNLLSQTLTEWTQESATPLHSFAVCSDAEVGKKRGKDDDSVQTLVHELRYPATTNPARLAAEIGKRHDAAHMSVVFSTYHSIDTIAQAQQQHGLAGFDLIICDEAHRTTGATFGDEDESAFVKVHDGAFIQSAKRLYMTATPRIYGDSAKASAEKDNVALCSMDDEKLYGKELYVITFSEAVKRGLLCDYKVLVLSVQESHVSRRLQDLLKDENNQLKVDDAAKIIGCWKALSKQGITDELVGDSAAMKRAVAFCQVIEAKQGGKVHKVSSKQIAGMFQAVVQAYQASEDNEAFDEADNRAYTLQCEAEHVDGGMSATEKEGKLAWLKAEAPDNTCRILSNVRCLSEGVDVPALDAVLFLTPRNSQVDVVQSVGRVMRNAPGKKRGYVILPVVIPAGVEPHEALNDNATYKVVWQVLQALRSHDDRFDAMVNKMDLDLNKKILSKMEVIAITDQINKKTKKTDKGQTNREAGKGQHGIGTPATRRPGKENQQELQFEIGEIERAIYAKVVQKCGNRHHWEDWANDIAKIARTHIDRISGILENPANTREQAAFNAFAHELRDDLNNSISDGEVIEMLAQHLITKPVFDALFENYSFAQHNPMSKAMQAVLDALHEHRLDKEADTLESFYASVKERAAGIESASGKQKIVVELYDKFFANAFPKLRDKLGIVYTPVEVVDFIIHSVNDVLQSEFGQTLGSPGVHIIDPFTGTGTFITRLLQSGLITPEQMPHKYQHEIHANEIVLLAYYIAAINIEAVYHSLVGGPYQPFEGICLTDTFQMYEKEDLVDDLLVDNSARRKRQKKLDIRVILGNPPYSIGQGSQNDNNMNVAYPHLDSRIEMTYAARSQATLAKGLYDSYIRAIRWASDRIGQSGVIGFVSGSGYAEKPAMDGMRKTLVEEFTNIHVFNLRGDIRKNMLSKGRAKEGQNVFDSGSMTGISITLFVKNPQAKEHGKVYYHDIGNDLTTKEKLEKISAFASIAGITAADGWQAIIPDTHGDWLQQRDDSFNDFIVLGDKKSDAAKLFENFSLGVVTNRDAWCYNPSRTAVENNMQRMIGFYNRERERFNAAHAGLDKKGREAAVDGFIDTDPTRISWTRALKQELAKDRAHAYQADSLITSLYRPYTKQWLYYSRTFNEMVLQMPRIFPDAAAENRVICVSGIGARSGFSVLMASTLPCLDTIEKGQCFPLYLYDEEAEASAGAQRELFAHAPQTAPKRPRRDALTDAGLAHFRAAYPGEAISKENVFYYVYGLLHSPQYRDKYADNLAKELPRIPCVKTAAGFWGFSQAGRKLAELHIGYESVAPYPLAIEAKGTLTDADYRVEQMKYGKRGKDKDLTTLHYNGKITLTGIPLAAYDYVVNGKPALDWVVERQRVKTDKDSGIENDANAWAVDTMNNPRYPLELFCRVVTVSLETMKIVGSLPALDI
jgi:predicted helicase